MDFHLLTGKRGRFANGASKSPFQVATFVLQTLLNSNDTTTTSSKKYYRLVIVDLSNMFGNDLYLDFVVAIDVFKSIFSAFNMEYMIVKSNFMRSIARKYINTAQLIDSSCHIDGTKCNVYYSQFVQETEDSIRTNNVGYVDSGPVVLGSRGVSEYRKATLLCVKPGDSVLEIGCHCGKTTKLIADAGANVIGIDIGKNIINNAMKRYPKVPFRVADAWDINTLMKLSRIVSRKEVIEKKSNDDNNDHNDNNDNNDDNGDNGEKKEKETSANNDCGGDKSMRSINGNGEGYDVICVDVGGLSGDNGLYENLSLLRELTHMFRPRLKAIIIKSACVRTFSK